MIKRGQEEMDTVEPLLPPEADIRDFPFMPLYVEHLTSSDFTAETTAEEFRAGVILWCKSWHQVPAGSLPDNDKALALLSGFGRDLEGWMKVREGALMNFVKASDGRLYHPFIAAQAHEAWERKQQQAAKRASHKEYMKKLREQKKPKDGEDLANDSTGDNSHDNTVSSHSEEDVKLTNASREKSVNSKTGTGTGTGTGTNKSLSPPPAAEEVLDGPSLKYTAEFEAWWAAYPRKSGKVAAFEAYKRAKKKIGPGAPEKLAAAVTDLAKAMAGKEERFIPHPTTWLNQGRWDDEPFKPAPGLLPHMIGRNRFGVGG